MKFLYNKETLKIPKSYWFMRLPKYYHMTYTLYAGLSPVVEAQASFRF